MPKRNLKDSGAATDSRGDLATEAKGFDGDEHMQFKGALKQLEDLPDFSSPQRMSKRQWVVEGYEQILSLREKGYPFSDIAQKVSDLMPEDSGISASTLAKHFKDITLDKRRCQRSRRKRSKSKRQ